ncbi:MAG TPA: MBL fold metallo-hydrolase, partial [Acidobacteriota bacterium]|nr:MBL fold metallo-hydrolase [Acidobacteriota bacterium]
MSFVKWGRFEIALLDAGRFALDGGAMFGVVPKVLWGKKAASDADNRVPLALNCLLVHAPEG